jgi:hypothetical protein
MSSGGSDNHLKTLPLPLRMRYCPFSVAPHSSGPLGRLPRELVEGVAEFCTAADVCSLRETSAIHTKYLRPVHVLRAATRSLSRVGAAWGLSSGVLRLILSEPDTYLTGVAASNAFFGHDGERAHIINPGRGPLGVLEITTTTTSRRAILNRLLHAQYRIDASRTPDSEHAYYNYECRRDRDIEWLLQQQDGDPASHITPSPDNLYDAVLLTACYKMTKLEATPVHDLVRLDPHTSGPDRPILRRLQIPVPTFSQIDVLAVSNDPIRLVKHNRFTMNQFAIRADSVEFFDRARSDLKTRTVRLSEKWEALIVARTNLAIKRAGIDSLKLPALRAELRGIRERIGGATVWLKEHFDCTLVNDWLRDYMYAQGQILRQLARAIQVISANCGL